MLITLSDVLFMSLFHAAADVAVSALKTNSSALGDVLISLID